MGSAAASSLCWVVRMSMHWSSVSRRGTGEVRQVRAKIAVLAVLLATAAAPGALGADGGEDLRESNQAVLLDGIEPGILEDATATVHVDGDERSMPATDALGLLLDRLDAAEVDLAEVEADHEEDQPEAAGLNTFPLVGTEGFIFEYGSGPGFSPPTTCQASVKHHQVSQGTLEQAPELFDKSHDGFVTTSMSQYVGSTYAAMSEPTATADDAVAGYSDVLAAGPNHSTFCAEFVGCGWWECYWYLVHDTRLAAGFVDNSPAADGVHDLEPLDLLPQPPG